MCIEKRKSHARLACVILFLVAIVLPFGLCQNAEARDTFEDRRKSDLSGDEPRFLETHQQYSRDEYSEKMEMLEENRRTLLSRGVIKEPEGTEAEAKAGTRGDERGNKHLLLSENGVKIPLRRNVNVTNLSKQQENNFGSRTRKKRRKDREPKNPGIKDNVYEISEDSRENEITGKRDESSRKRSSSLSKSRSKNQEARKSRAERRRRKKKDRRERNRGRKNSRQNNKRQDIARRSKHRRKAHDGPDGLPLEKLDFLRANTSEHSSENSSNVTFDHASSMEAVSMTTPLNFQHHSTLEVKLTRTTPRRGIHVADTVEREFSKQLEMEISKSVSKNPSILDDDIFDSFPRKSVEQNVKSMDKIVASSDGKIDFGNSRYDAERMLGYSRTEEDLPILDLENEMLERTLKDYNAYMTSKLKPASLPRYDELTMRRTSGSHPLRKPIINSEESAEQADDRDMEVMGVTKASQDDTTRGDLSCINGTFLPAPLSRHALIKYVKSSTPGHEYLEADYECVPGFHMVSSTSRLVCRDRQWVGQVPKCEIKQNPNGVCAEISCEHVCNEINGRPFCSCYEGFRLDGHRCVDINECLLNNGHGPCQDTCRNLIGGYECSCEGLQDALLAADNHTCERDRHTGPCSVNNAGCSHTCLSTMGRVFCLCPDGFMLEDDWKTCQDVDECLVPDLQTELCRYGCINTPGSYRCAEPMEVKDQPVLDSLSITCLPGYEQTSHGTCIDINECMVDNGGCTEVCENTDGSFFCACDGDEKALSSDGKSCVDINSIACLPLDTVNRGYLICSRLATSKMWRDRRKVPNRPGTRCFLKCPRGYQLRGEYELTCRSDGTWDGPQHGKCIRYSKPRLECPKDVVVELPPGRSEAFVTYDQPATDLDWFRYVRSKPSWGTRLEASLKPGVHEITFFARHPVSKKQSSCVLRIIVKDGEAPKVKDCPRDIEVIGQNGTSITWTEPTFTDNVMVTRISNNENPGRHFDIGGHKIEYEASDEAGWSSKCIFTVVLRRG